MNQENKEDEKNTELKELVLARISLMPPNFKLSIGGQGILTKEQLIKHIKKGDETGTQIIKMQMDFIKALTSGELIETLNK